MQLLIKLVRLLRHKYPIDGVLMKMEDNLKLMRKLFSKMKNIDTYQDNKA
jgi:hypothetical protein